MPNRYTEALKVAEDNGHTLVDDPPSIPSTMNRQTCSKCGAAVLGNPNNAYGSGITTRCPPVISTEG